MTITRLMDKIQADEAGAAEALVESYQTDLLRLANAILNDPAEAEEAVQDAMLAAIHAVEQYRGEAALKTWLFRIAINTCRNRLRKRRRREQVVHALQAIFRVTGVGPTQPEEHLIRGETRTEVRRAVQALGEKHRLPVLLFYDYDLSVAEIAQALDLPQGTVLSRLHAAREKLRIALQDQLHPDGEAR